MTTQALVALATTIAAITAIIVQLIKQAVIDPHSTDSPARDAVIRGISYALNLGLLLGYLALNGQLDGAHALDYLALSLGQFGVSHVLYSALSNGSTVASAPTAEEPPNPASDSGGGA